jgi:hypothetical protein
LKADRDLTPSGRTKKFREQEADIRKSALAKLDGTKALMESKIKDAEGRMSAPPPPEDDAGLHREGNLIAAIRGMTAEQRAELNTDDDEIAGAILRSHHIAVGMTKNEQELFRASWLRKRFPADVEKLNRLNQALGHIERAVPIFTAYAEETAKSLAGGVHVSRY